MAGRITRIGFLDDVADAALRASRPAAACDPGRSQAAIRRDLSRCGSLIVEASRYEKASGSP